MTTTVFARPALPDLIARVTQQIQASMPGTDPALRRAVTVVMGAVLARELASEYAYLDNLAQWFFVATTSGQYMDLKGNPVGVFREQAAAAAGSVAFTGIPQQPIPAGSLLASQDDTQSYTLGAAVTLDVNGNGTGLVTSTSGASASNQPAGTILTLSVAVPGVNAQATVLAPGLTGGLDLETDAAYRVRVLARLQQPPQGGAARDYVAWAKLVPGVTRVWVYPLNRGPGTVDFAFVLDGRAVGGGSILPTPTDVAAVQASVDEYAPVVASSQNQPLTANSINVTISNLVPLAGYTKAQALANAQASLAGLFASTTPGGAGYGDGIPPGGTGGTLLLKDIDDAVDQSAGVGGYDLTAPTSDVVSTTGQLAVLGAVTAP